MVLHDDYDWDDNDDDWDDNDDWDDDDDWDDEDIKTFDIHWPFTFDPWILSLYPCISSFYADTTDI